MHARTHMQKTDSNPSRRPVHACSVDGGRAGRAGGKKEKEKKNKIMGEDVGRWGVRIGGGRIYSKNVESSEKRSWGDCEEGICKIGSRPGPETGWWWWRWWWRWD